MLDLLQGGASALALAREALGAGSPIPLVEVQLKAPIARPGKILGIGLNYADHAAEGGRQKPDYPLIFAKTVPATIGMGEAIQLPRVSQMVDFEGELAVVIGSLARAVSAQDALDYVAGYTICNDVSARDYQRRSGHTPGKSFETFAPLGPAIVTRDSIPDPHLLDIRTVVSGQEMQALQYETSDFSDSVFDRVSVAYLSSGTGRCDYHRNPLRRRGLSRAAPLSQGRRYSPN